jgi:VWFA-related protein
MPRRRVSMVAEVGSVVVLLMAAVPSHFVTRSSQQSNSQSAAPVDQQSQSSIRSRAGEVIVPVTVTDEAGELILDLDKNDFRIYDNGVEQQIEHFDLGGVRASIVLVVARGAQVQGLLPGIRRSGVVFADTVMTSTNEAAVIGFDNMIEVIEKLTTDQEVVQKSIAELQPGVAGSKLYDAMSRAVLLLDNQPPEGRRVIVVVSEAQDRGSKATLAEVVWEANLANVTIYSIALSTFLAQWRAPLPQFPPRYTPSPPVPYPFPMPYSFSAHVDLSLIAEWVKAARLNVLGAASAATGGLFVNTYEENATVGQAMDRIGGELSSQYTLGFRAPANGTQGFHKIRVEVDRPGVTIRTRPGYFLAPPR